MDDYRHQITPAQAARLLDITPSRVRQLMTDGALTYVRTPLGRLIDARDVEELRHVRAQRRADRAAVVA